ncbi:hypothetical protein NW755_002912 [Fusarium falciforme]|uniref:Uncharacterized protein n=1 Tax=Fusarium falciforme TaxID=195108 RepID=A0A9W8V4J7_9HYPO|nr:hypothetical protein NW755_002912 [Fusarium falciforme]KAJ4248849.1 hypothetical protein NW757_007963 [Fusarium falciforme]
MRPPNIPLLGLLPIVLILICLSGGSAQLIRRQHPNVVRKDNFIEAREPSDVDATGFGYGPPPPYYTGAPATSAESKIREYSDFVLSVLSNESSFVLRGVLVADWQLGD